jgi:histone acetyltransferase (RNA polymerase elongator complex component)
MAKQFYIIPIFVPHRGCPHQCVFCNQREISGVVKQITGEMVRETIQRYLQTIPGKPGIRVEVAFYGGSFTAIPREEQAELLQPATRALKNDLIHGIRVSTRPDWITPEILEFLQGFGVGVIELGVQSMDPEVLTRSNRGHDPQQVVKAAHLIKQAGVSLGLQMMVGLPGDSPLKSIETAQAMARLRPDFVRIYPVLVVEGTPLAQDYQDGYYKPLSLPEAIDICADLLVIFHQHRIPVIRLGLQPSEEITYHGKVLAGPFHPALRELVEAKVAHRQLISLLTRVKRDSTKMQEATFAVSPKDISIVRGQRNANFHALIEEFGLEQIYLVADPVLLRGEIKLLSCDGRQYRILSTRDEF